MSFYPLRYAYTPVNLPFTRATFPYRYYFHGRYDCDYPLVDERRAGYCPRVDLRPALPPLVKPYKKPDQCFFFSTEHMPCHRHLLGSHNRNRLRLVRDPDNRGSYIFNIAEPPEEPDPVE